MNAEYEVGFVARQYCWVCKQILIQLYKINIKNVFLTICELSIGKSSTTGAQVVFVTRIAWYSGSKSGFW